MNSLCTIIAKNYLSYAMTLMESYKEHHPKNRCYLLIVDEYKGYINNHNDTFEIIDINELRIPKLKEYCFKYNITELSTAVKPYLMKYLITSKEINKLIYLDPDILVTDKLDCLYDFLEDNDIIVTPHLDKDYPSDNLRPDDAHIMKSGTFNLGFIGVRRCENVLNFLNWWHDKLYDKCIISHKDGYFVDQKYIDLALCLFKNFHIIHDTGYNVAYWNLHSRSVSNDGEKWRCNGDKLYFFHFSGYNPKEPDQISVHQNRFKLSECFQLKKLFNFYNRQLIKNGYNDSHNWPYTYGFFKNGKIISDPFRVLFRKNINKLKVDNPFDYNKYPLSFKIRYVLISIYKNLIRKIMNKLKFFLGI